MALGAAALITLPTPSSPAGVAFDEQASTAPLGTGNKFDADGCTMLYVRNTTASALALVFYTDLGGAEVDAYSVSIPGSGTENGVKIVGPFPSLLTDHSQTAAADNGKIYIVQTGGVAGDLVYCPFRVNLALS